MLPVGEMKPAVTTSVPKHWPARLRAAEILGVGQRQLSHMCDDGRIAFVVDDAGWRRFDPEDLRIAGERLKIQRRQRATRKDAEKRAKGEARRKTAGEIEAEVFRLLHEGRELREVVILAEVTAAYVIEARKNYAAMGADFLLSSGEVEELRELVDWQGDDGRSLIDAVNQRLRYQFRRGRACVDDAVLSELDAENKPNEGIERGTTDTGRTASEEGSDFGARENDLRSDRKDGAADVARAGGAEQDAI
jgi:hypothetical protein